MTKSRATKWNSKMPSFGTANRIIPHCEALLLLCMEFIDSSVDSDTASSPDILSDDGTEDEGIETSRYSRKHQGMRLLHATKKIPNSSVCM